MLRSLSLFKKTSGHIINIIILTFGCRINHTVILDDPFDDPPDLPVPDRSPEPTKEQLDVSIGPQLQLDRCS